MCVENDSSLTVKQIALLVEGHFRFSLYVCLIYQAIYVSISSSLLLSLYNISISNLQLVELNCFKYWGHGHKFSP